MLKGTKLTLTLFSLLLITGLIACSTNNYPSNKAIANGDVVYFNETYNLDTFQRFIANVETQQPDSIRITGYTEEGDALIKDLKFDGEAIHYTYDNSRDKHGGKNKGKHKDICTTITAEQSEEWGYNYIISDCTNNDPKISYFLLRTENELQTN